MSNADSKRIFAVALTFPEPVQKKLARLSEDYRQYMRYNIVPHMTLVYPFVPIFSLFQVKEQLENVARRTPEFDIILSGIDYFEGEHNVAYAALENKRAVRNLHADIINSLDGLIKEWYTDGIYNLDNFVPHVTIANKIPLKVFADIKKRLSGYRLRCKHRVADFSLFEEEGGNWETNQVFELTGDKDGRYWRLRPRRR
jgi:poly(A) polymerase